VGLLDDALLAGGGLDLWRRMRRFTVHMSIRGTLTSQRCRGVELPEFVVEGDPHEPVLEIVGFTAQDLSALCRPGHVILERPDGRHLEERRARPEELTLSLKSPVWDTLQLAFFCAGLVWNHLTVPFILTEPGFESEELVPLSGQSWRRLKVVYPARLTTHAPEQTLYFDRRAILRRLDYPAAHADDTRIAQMLSGHQRYSGILVPTMSRLLAIEAGGALVEKPPLLDFEIFEAHFE
jgi:hypothetical protein